MKIERFLSYDLFRDGGTFSCSIQFSGGNTEFYGIDGRIQSDTENMDRTIFRKAKWIGDSASELLIPNSKEEVKFLKSLVQYLDQRCSFLRRESLDQLNYNELNEEDKSDYIAVQFFKLIVFRSKTRKVLKRNSQTPP